MKKILKDKTFIAEIDRDEDGFFHARVKNLPHCYTQAKDIGTLLKRLREVILLCLDIYRDAKVTAHELKDNC